MNSSCCSFPTKDIFVSEPLCVPFTKEFLSDFLFSDNGHPGQEAFATHQEMPNQPAAIQCFETSHRPADHENGFDESSNRISPELGNYWLYHHREHVWTDEDQADACAPIRRNKRCLRCLQSNSFQARNETDTCSCRTVHQSDLSTKRRVIEDPAQCILSSKLGSNEPQESFGSNEVLTVGLDASTAQCLKSKQPSQPLECELKQDISDPASKGSLKRLRSSAPTYADFEYSTVRANHLHVS